MNRILGIACVIAVAFTLVDIVSKHAHPGASFSLGGSGLLSPFAVITVVFTAQMLLMIGMIIHSVRHPRWTFPVKALAILGSIISFVSAGIYLFSYRPMANTLMRVSTFQTED